MKPSKRKWEDWGQQAFLLALLQALLVPYNQLGRTPPPPTSEVDWTTAPPSWRDAGVSALARLVYPAEGLQTRVLTESYPPLPGLANSRAGASWGVGGSGASTSRDLSLEEADLIDVLWRADIDLEKGRVPVVPTPDQQHEQDMDLLTQKHLSRDFALPFAPQDENDASFMNRLSDFKNSRMEAPKSWVPMMDTSTMYDDDFAKASTVEFLDENSNKASMPDPTLAEKRVAGDEFDWKDWLEAGEKAVREEACEAATNLEEFLGSLDGSLDEDALLRSEGRDVCLSSVAAQPSEDPFFGHALRVRPEPLSLGVPLGDLDEIQTPSLDLSPMEVGQLFADHQVATDVAASVSALSPDHAASSADSAVAWGSADSSASFHRRHRSAFSASSDASGSTWVEMSDGVLAMPDYAAETKEALPTTAAAAPRMASPPVSIPSPSLWLDHDYLDPTSPVASSGGRWDNEEGKLRPTIPHLGQRVKEEELDEEETAEERRVAGRRSEDEALCAAHDLPYSPADIVNMPLHVFQGLARDTNLSESQIEIIKKIRRRGKNKLAARNCRKRKNTNLEQLDTETSLLTQERRVESRLNTKLKSDIAREQAEIDALERELGQLDS